MFIVLRITWIGQIVPHILGNNSLAIDNMIIVHKIGGKVLERFEILETKEAKQLGYNTKNEYKNI